MVAVKLHRAPAVLHRRVDDKTILVDNESGKIFTLNRTGSRAWELLRDGITRQQLASRLSSEFDVGAADLEFELEAVLHQLEEEGLIRIDSAGGGRKMPEVPGDSL